jgi:hypothetical protein
MLISKMQTCLCDKLLLKKLKLKNEKIWDLAKFENGLLNLTLFGGIISLRQVCFFEISITVSIFLYPI